MHRSGRRTLGVVLGLLVGIGTLAGAYGFLFGVGPDPGTCACTPGAEFAFEGTSSRDAVAVTVTHGGGESFDAGRLRVGVDGRTRTWASLADVPATSDVAPGDSVTVTAAAGDEIRVTVRTDGGRRVTVATHAVG